MSSKDTCRRRPSIACSPRSPTARGLAVPGMPIGSPGMEGGTPEVYEVILFGKDHPVSFGRFIGDRPA